MRLGIEAWLRLIAGALITISTALGVYVNPWFHAFTVFVGLNLFQSALTGYCPMMTILKKMGVRP